jgi:transketolase
MDAVQKANSGHPGTPMALAPDRLRPLHADHAPRPEHPDWPNRDRFVLSAGHASMLLYAMLYLTGYGLTLEDLKHFRQLGSPSAGHPEYGHAPASRRRPARSARAMRQRRLALGERMLNARLGDDVIDHHTFAIASDGDMQEGIAAEAASLAGHLGSAA